MQLLPGSGQGIVRGSVHHSPANVEHGLPCCVAPLEQQQRIVQRRRAAARQVQHPHAAGQQPAGIRVRVLGRYKPTTLRAYAAPADAALADVDTLSDAVEFTLPAFRTLVVIDMEAHK